MNLINKIKNNSNYVDFESDEVNFGTDARYFIDWEIGVMDLGRSCGEGMYIIISERDSNWG